MNIHFFFSPLPSSLSIISIFILIVLPIACSDDNGQFLECNETFSCGIIQGMQYPFWGSVRPRYCGHGGFELICEENQFPVITIDAQRFRVLNVSTPGTMSIAPVDIWEDSCPEQFHNITLDHNLFDFAATFRNLSIFYGCPLDDDIPSQNRFSCPTLNGNIYAYHLDESLLRIHRSELADCNVSIRLPVNGNEFDELRSGNDTVMDAWNKGFDVMYHKDIMECMACRNSGGVCGSDNTTLEFLCFCRDQPHPQFCLASDDENFEQCFSRFDCGDIKNLTYPYWTDDRPQLCKQEGFRLTKCEDEKPVIHIGRYEFRMIYLNHFTYAMTISRNDLWEKICPENPINVTLENPFLRYSPTNRHLTFFYNCNLSIQPSPNPFRCTEDLYSFYADDLVERARYGDLSDSCDTAIQVQVNQSAFAELQNQTPQRLEAWKLGFDVVYNLAEILCSACNNSRRGKCEILSSQYPICNNPGHLPSRVAVLLGSASWACLLWPIGLVATTIKAKVTLRME
ncbi:hypothetical protein POUND7_006210 [Theobroma cacao]